ncbi:MAG: NADP-dependent oxidoreductase [bacterium]|nr:NADP-dependent oxidoreductase [bacterium]
MNTMNTMKAAAIQAYGDADSFEMIQLPVPEAEPGEVLLQVAYVGVNPADWKFRAGLVTQFYKAQFPFVLGLDVSGVVVAIGEGVTQFAPGDKVFALMNISEGRLGSYAEYAVADEDRIARVPEGIRLKSAAVIPCAALTGWQDLFYEDRGNLQAGQQVLINGGSGGLGSYAVQFAKWAGADVAATCGPTNLDYVQSLGADLVIDYRNQEITSELATWAPEGVDMILDTVGAKSLPDAVSMIKAGGKLVNVPTLVVDVDGDVATDIANAAKQGVTKVYAFLENDDCGKELKQIVDLVAHGSVIMPPIEVFAIEDVSDAHKKVQDGHVRGKLVLEVGGESLNE